MLPCSAQSRDEPLAALLAAPPPRAVPRGLLRAARQQAAATWLLVFGLVFAAAGAVGMAEYFPWHYSAEHRLAAADTARALGRIVAVDKTRLAVGRRRVLRFTFEFTPAAGGAPARGESYLLAPSSAGTVWNPATRRPWQVGDPATVRYRSEEPALAQLAIVGAHLDPAGLPGWLTAIPVAIGLGLLAGVGLARRRAVRLLTHGVLVEGRVIAVERLGLGDRRRPSVKITLRHADDPDLPPWKIQRDHPAVVALAWERLASGRPALVLYDPAQPARVLLPEALGH